jgi:hypothetical protein
MAVWLVAQLATSPYTIMMTARVLRTGRLAPVRAGLPALGVAAAAVGAALLVPWLLGEPVRPVALIAARLAAGAPVCLLGLAWLARGIVQRQRRTRLHPKALGL